MGTFNIAFCSVFTLLFYITSSASPDPNLGNVLSALYKQAAKSNKALVLVMDKKKNLNPPENDEKQPKTHKHKPVYQYKSSSETQDEVYDYKPVHYKHKHYHQHKGSYEYGYNPQTHREHNHGHYHHHEPVNPHAYASSHERPYYQEFSSYETLHDHHPLRAETSSAPFKKINREGIMIKSLRNLLKESLQRGKSRSKNELNKNKVARYRHDQSDNNEPAPYHFDRHGRLIHDNNPETSREQNSYEKPHNRAQNERQHQHGHDHEEYRHNHEEPHQHNHDHGERHERVHDHGEQHEHSHDRHHSHEDAPQHRHEEQHNHETSHHHGGYRDESHGYRDESYGYRDESHGHRDEPHGHRDEPHDHGHGHKHYYDLRQKDRNLPAAVTTATPDPKATLDRHSNNYHMQKAFKALRSKISCESQALCIKECLGDATCQAKCKQVFICDDNGDSNGMERPVAKAGIGRCDDDCGDDDEDEDDCPTECPTKKPTCSTTTKRPCTTPCPTKDPCDQCSDDEPMCSTAGYEEEPEDRKKR